MTLYREAKFVEYLEKQAVLPAPGTPAEFLQFLKRDREDAEFLIRISNPIARGLQAAVMNETHAVAYLA